MLKLLIADESEDFRLALAQQLAGIYVIRMCRTGREALELAGSFRPDAIVMDVMLPELDGVSLIQQIRQMGLHSQILVTATFRTDYITTSLSRLGIGYMMIKPCDIRATVARLRELTEPMIPMTPARPDLKTAVTNHLQRLGVATKLRGFAYLREAIILYMRKPGQMVTKEIYPEVASLCDAEWKQVERSIRSAISGAYQRRNEAVWRQYFTCESDSVLERPSNTAFISAVANILIKDEMLVNYVRTSEKYNR